MTESEMSALLGRPLTSLETANFDEYLEIAEQLLEDVLCYSPFALSDSGEPEVRYFDARKGYSTVFIGAFEGEPVVEINGNEVTNFKPYLWDTRNSSWYNSLVFDCKFTCDTEIAVTASWGFVTLPLDLQRLLSKYFAFVSSGAKTEMANIHSKDVEDFQITYDRVDKTKAQVIADENALTIKKYSMCGIGKSRSNEVCRWM